MACSRGKAHPNTNTKLKLFAHSAGYCQNPNCGNLLFPEGHSRNIHIAEMAHIFACADSGPRAVADLSAEERGAYENIILLCANCHTVIDKAPEQYSDQVITKWKREHWARVCAAFGVIEFSSRAQLRAALSPLLGENKAIHRAIGPDSEYRHNPEAPEATSWKVRMCSSIIPNSNRIIAILDRNLRLLSADEVETLHDFKVHVGGLILRHIDGQEIVNSRFPAGMDEIAEARAE